MYRSSCSLSVQILYSIHRKYKGNFCEAILLVYRPIEALFVLSLISQNLKGFTLIYNFMLKQKLLKGKDPKGEWEYSIIIATSMEQGRPKQATSCFGPVQP